MEQRGQLAASKMIESLTCWWELAGVDSYVGNEPVDWLGLDAKANEPALSSVAETPNPIPATPSIDWPGDIAALRALIGNGAALPCNAFGPKPVVSAGPHSCEVMIISDLPDQDEVARIGSGASGALLTRMLAAIGISLPESHWTALAMTVPPTGEVPEPAFPALADFVRHQIGLVKPKSLVLLGSATCKAMLGDDLMSARAELRNINYDGRKMAALATFHPRTLIARPAMKAQAWKDLQMFAKRTDL